MEWISHTRRKQKESAGVMQTLATNARGTRRGKCEGETLFGSPLHSFRVSSFTKNSCPPHSLPISLSLSPSLPHTHTQTHTLSLTHSHALSLSLETAALLHSVLVAPTTAVHRGLHNCTTTMFWQVLRMLAQLWILVCALEDSRCARAGRQVRGQACPRDFLVFTHSSHRWAF